MGWYEKRFTARKSVCHVSCVSCGCDMWLPPSKANLYKTCGKECAKKSRADALEKRKRKCETCGRVFYPRPGQISKGQGRFCSQACNTTSHAAMNSKESQRAAKKEWKRINKINPIVKSGKENPLWKGGRKAINQRVIAKRRSDPFLKFKCNVRISMAHAFRESGYKKGSRTEGILGCTFEELKHHMEQQFTKGMNWGLVGSKIHVDHIVPLASATTKEEVIKLCHFTNLRPLWAKDNLSKSSKREYLV